MAKMFIGAEDFVGNSLILLNCEPWTFSGVTLDQAEYLISLNKAAKQPDIR